jgi:acetyl-CoA synthetase
VGYSHQIYGEGIFAYISLKENVKESEENIIKELKLNVKQKISGYAVPHNFLVI